MIRSLARVAAIATLAASPAAAQGVQIRGIAFDSLHAEPLRGATVTLAGRGRSTTTDGRGRFAFDTVTPGALTVIVYHAVLDTIGLGAISAHVNVTDGRDEVHVTVPSFATMWRAACGADRLPGDSGFVYGSIRDALTQSVVGGAIVSVGWDEAVVDASKHVAAQRQRKLSRTDTTGTYGVCGVPMSAMLHFQASDSTRSSGAIDVVGDGTKVRRRDLLVGPTTLSNAVRRGTVVGLVTAPGGAPVEGARVVVPDVPETRSGADGRFVLRDVPPGTRELQILAVGASPRSMVVDVPPGDTAVVSAELQKVPTLDAVRVMAARQQFMSALDDRRKLGLGYIADSTTLAKMGTLMAGFGSMPNVRVAEARTSRAQYVVTLPRGAGRCLANLWLDGVRLGADDMAYDVLTDMRPDEIAAIEIYARGVPNAFATPRSECGAVVVWTKRRLGG